MVSSKRSDPGSRRTIKTDIDERREGTESPHIMDKKINTPKSSSTPVSLITEEDEVTYDGGATELFKLIENSEWDTAIRVCAEKPKQAKTWVVSTGTDNTVFNWSIWKRLPIHEACRRQPPAVLISTLLSVHPESCGAVTHFGELPLHLAVGCGASPEVVNILIASNPPSVTAADNGGRTAIEILNDSGHVREDSPLIIESLKRCQTMMERNQEAWERSITEIHSEHDEKVTRISRQHEQALAVKEVRITDLINDVKRGEARAQDLSKQIDERESKIDSKNSVERNLMDLVRDLEGEASSLRNQNRTLRSKVSELDDAIVRKDFNIDRLNEKVDELTRDLVSVGSAQEALVDRELRKAEYDLNQMMDSQRALLNQVWKQRELVRSVISERGIDTQTKETPVEEAVIKVPSDDESRRSEAEVPDGHVEEENVNHVAAANAAAAAAAAAANALNLEY